MTTRHWRLTWVVVCLVSVGTGCAGSMPEPVAPESGPLAGELVDAQGKSAPQWVTAPATYRKDTEDMKVVCGEGSIKGTRNMNMAQTAAAGRARTALARSLEVKLKSMLKDYQATTTGGEQFAEAANDEQHVEDVSKQITQLTLSGTEVNETWISSQSTLHSLVCLNIERFKGIVRGMKQLDDALRTAIVERAEKAWSELDDATSAHVAPGLRTRADATPMAGSDPTVYIPGTKSTETDPLNRVMQDMDDQNAPQPAPSPSPSPSPTPSPSSEEASIR